MEEQQGANSLSDDRHELFCQEYLKDLNVTQAGIRAGYSPESARQSSHVVFKRPEVQDRIAYLKKDRAEALKIEQIDVLSRLWSIATADPRDLVKYKIVNCRHCWGENHEYQWVDEHEYEKVCQEYRENELPEPMCDGGFGFRRTKAPNPDCTKCDGEGKGYVHVEDTSNLSETAKLLYAGVEQGKEGIKVKMHDQMNALKLVGQHIGMFKEKVELTGQLSLQPPVFNIVGVKPNGDKE